MSAGEIAGLIAAIAFALLVVLLAIPLLKLGRTLDETTLTVRQAREQTAPILAQASPRSRTSTATWSGSTASPTTPRTSPATSPR